MGPIKNIVLVGGVVAVPLCCCVAYLARARMLEKVYITPNLVGWKMGKNASRERSENKIDVPKHIKKPYRRCEAAYV